MTQLSSCSSWPFWQVEIGEVSWLRVLIRIWLLLSETVFGMTSIPTPTRALWNTIYLWLLEKSPVTGFEWYSIPRQSTLLVNPYQGFIRGYLLPGKITAESSESSTSTQMLNLGHYEKLMSWSTGIANWHFLLSGEYLFMVQLATSAKISPLFLQCII